MLHNKTSWLTLPKYNRVHLLPQLPIHPPRRCCFHLTMGLWDVIPSETEEEASSLIWRELSLKWDPHLFPCHLQFPSWRSPFLLNTQPCSRAPAVLGRAPSRSLHQARLLEKDVTSGPSAVPRLLGEGPGPGPSPPGPSPSTGPADGCAVSCRGARANPARGPSGA